MRTPLIASPLVAALLLFVSLLSPGASHAGKPQWVEEGKPGKSDKHGNQGRPHGDEGQREHPSRPPVTGTGGGVSVQIQIGGYFSDDHRHVARAYYEPRWSAGHCPPGLAKKGNGCQPPGQARKWHRGQPLPRDVIYYPVPASVQVKLGAPPAGHKFVRVATDLLLIAIGTGMVIDAIEDLGQL